MYTRSAEFYDLLYAAVKKDYRKESTVLIDIIDKSIPAAKSLLDVACGTGEHDRHLKSRFAVQGLDLNEAFVEIARKKNPECRYHVGDMESFSIEGRFDVIACLFSAIGFLSSVEGLVTTVSCMKRHLKPGGMIIIEPWFTPETWVPDKRPVHLTCHDAPDVKYVRVSRSRVEGRVSILHDHYIYADRSRFEHFEETGRLFLFERADFAKAFADNNLAMVYEENGLTGRGLYIAR